MPRDVPNQAESRKSFAPDAPLRRLLSKNLLRRGAGTHPLPMLDDARQPADIHPIAFGLTLSGL